jgi:hypothetical protein
MEDVGYISRVSEPIKKPFARILHNHPGCCPLQRWIANRGRERLDQKLQTLGFQIIAILKKKENQQAQQSPRSYDLRAKPN